MVNFPNPKNSENLAAVIGLPVRHSLSPLIYNTAFRIDSLNWDFHAVEVSEGQIKESIEFVRNNNIKGVSVTMPLKEVILPYLDQLTEAAKELKAVNCVYWNEGELIGDNTDGDGFLNSLLSEFGEGIRGDSFAVLGAGGAARSIIRSLREADVDEIIVINRNTDRAATAEAIGGSRCRIGSVEELGRCRFVINATSLGMAGTGNEGLLAVPRESIREHHVVIDLVYNPISTPLLKEAKTIGARAITGVEMLIHQAALQYFHWTNIHMQIPEIQRIITSKISNNSI
ncbi:MAG: shikimate dehydrogenase [Actinomycetota bacterium]|nr:shikimate dehydrogenase [Actinomycetota bacterium]